MTQAPKRGQRESQRRSVEHLQELYSVVVAIALSLAVDRLLPVSALEARARGVALTIALLVTLVPFYHGALRHLDEQYGHRTDGAAHQFSVLVDFVVLFLESFVFLALAVSIARPAAFAGFFVALLALDVAWAYLTTRYLVAEPEQPAQQTWLVLNLACASVLLVVLVVLYGDAWQSPTVLASVVCVTAILRTAFDYGLSWRFYVAAPEAVGPLRWSETE
jgi:hypothetical protein